MKKMTITEVRLRRLRSRHVEFLSTAACIVQCYGDPKLAKKMNRFNLKILDGKVDFNADRMPYDDEED